MLPPMIEHLLSQTWNRGNTLSGNGHKLKVCVRLDPPQACVNDWKIVLIA